MDLGFRLGTHVCKALWQGIACEDDSTPARALLQAPLRLFSGDSGTESLFL